jgi:acetyl-CoA carboxylase carboxyltransferase component
MDVIETRIDTNSDEYKKNYDAMEALVGDLKAELKKAREERPQKDIDRLAAQGKIPVRKKLEMLLDRNTPFLEIAPLAARGMYDGRVHAAGLVTGIGIVEGHEVLVVASDAMIKAGGLPHGGQEEPEVSGHMYGEPPSHGQPAGLGRAYLPMQSEIFRISMTAAGSSTTRRHLQDGHPQITAVMGLCTAGGAYVPAMSDEVVHVKGTEPYFWAGPACQSGNREEVTADQLGGAEVHCVESGVSDYFAEDDAHAISIVGRSSKPFQEGKSALEPSRSQSAHL